MNAVNPFSLFLLAQKKNRFLDLQSMFGRDCCFFLFLSFLYLAVVLIVRGCCFRFERDERSK